MTYGRTSHMIYEYEYDRTLVNKTSLTECDYITRVIFKDVY